MTRSTKIKLLGAGIVVAAVVGGGAAFAATKALSPHEEAQAVIDDAAKQLGVTPSELSDALKQALKNRVDEALADGRITKAQADALKHKIDANDVPLGFGPFGLGALPKDFGLFPGHLDPFGKLSIAADYLGLSESELASRLADGKTLAEIARAEGKSVDGLVAALVKDASDKIDAAVDAGTITESQAKDLKADLKDRITELVNGQMGFRFRGGGSAFNFGFDFRFARPDLGPGFPGLDPDHWHRNGSSA